MDQETVKRKSSVMFDDTSDIEDCSDTASQHDDDTPTANLEKEEEIALRESKAIGGLRLVVFGLLFVSMVLVATFTYIFTSRAEVTEFEHQFEEDANKILQSVGASVDSTMAAVDAFVIGILSYARETNQTWPFVTVPDLEARASKVLALTKAVVIFEFLLVMPEQREKWESYTAEKGPAWVKDSMDFLKRTNKFQDAYTAFNITEPTLLNFVHDYSAWGVEDPKGLPANHSKPMLPTWQSAPLIPTTPAYNWDAATLVDNLAYLKPLENHKVAMSRVYHIAEPGDTAAEEENQAWADFFSSYLTTGENPMEPLTDFSYPIIEDLLDDPDIRKRDDYDPSQHKVGGLLTLSVYWREWIKEILPANSNGILAVIKTSCSPAFTYEINGPTVQFLGVGDLHDPKYDYLEVSARVADLRQMNTRQAFYASVPLDEEVCPYVVHIYPSQKREYVHISQGPVLYTVALVAIFIITAVWFVLYDWCVQRRQKVVMQSAARSNKIVSSLFPSNVRDRLYEQDLELDKRKEQGPPTAIGPGTETTNSNVPIADLFPEATVLFADVAGFTAWSSTREPSQVFTLLEKLYGEFDIIADRRKVFKVETIGDCYMAVCGVPTPRENHAQIMSRFAAEIRTAMNALVQELELTLGPGTSELLLRCGLHSGPVTAGVLRGQRARFQLFGDTVNTAARMESTGVPNKIQISKKTADLLIASGKKAWVVPRNDAVVAKGKGAMHTFWVEPSGGRAGSIGTSSYTASRSAADDMGPRVDILIEWNVKLFEGMVKNVVAHREAQRRQSHVGNIDWNVEEWSDRIRAEVVDCITLSDSGTNFIDVDPDSVKLSSAVKEQLFSFISAVGYSYNNNPFHNFDHASHVASSSKKLLHRISTIGLGRSGKEAHSKTFGVAVDPLAHLAIVFSALIHDADHRGVANATLIKEDPPLAGRFSDGSIAEQNSVAIAWEIFMDPTYRDLRDCLFTTKEELYRFRQLVVNSVIATDIFDPTLKKMREDRWTKAFSSSSSTDSNDTVVQKQMATIVMEYVIQASDVCHTMQHWTVFQKWNRRLFDEMYTAFLNGRVENDPSVGWYNGELWFFDNYVIPLAQKLLECEVFGASGNEFLDYATENRLEWSAKGQRIVEEMKEACLARHRNNKISR